MSTIMSWNNTHSSSVLLWWGSTSRDRLPDYESDVSHLKEAHIGNTIAIHTYCAKAHDYQGIYSLWSDWTMVSIPVVDTNPILVYVKLNS